MELKERSEVRALQLEEQFARLQDEQGWRMQIPSCPPLPPQTDVYGVGDGGSGGAGRGGGDGADDGGGGGDGGNPDGDGGFHDSATEDDITTALIDAGCDGLTDPRDLCHVGPCDCGKETGYGWRVSCDCEDPDNAPQPQGAFE